MSLLDQEFVKIEHLSSTRKNSGSLIRLLTSKTKKGNHKLNIHVGKLILEENNFGHSNFWEVFYSKTDNMIIKIKNCGEEKVSGSRKMVYLDKASYCHLSVNLANAFIDIDKCTPEFEIHGNEIVLNLNKSTL